MENKISPQSISELTAARQATLAQLRPQLSLELAAKIEVKLALEAKDMAALISADQVTQARLSHYTFVLDAQYFEQKFLT